MKVTVEVIRFRVLSITAASISCLLFLTLLLVPQLIFMLFEIEATASASFLARRAAMLFLGYAVITYVSRNAEHSSARQAISLGLAATWVSLAVLGVFELVRGVAGFGILLAIGAELLLAFAYGSIWFVNRHKHAEI